MKTFHTFLAVSILSAGSAFGAAIAPAFSSSYTYVDLGAVPGLSSYYGGLIVKAGDNSTLLIGGNANTGSAEIDSIGVTRDTNGHITGFTGSAALFSTAPNIDGGLAYAPNGDLLYTGYPNNVIGEIKPGSSSPDKVVSAPVDSSVGVIAIIPGGFNNAGIFVVGSYSAGTFCTSSLTDDGSGTYDVGACTNTISAGSGPEGIVYVPIGSPVFGSTQTALISDYGLGEVFASAIDANGLPTGTPQGFFTGLDGAEGATIDPVTGDFLFSTFGGGNHVYAVQGFVAPPSDTPEPGTLLLLVGAGLSAFALRRRFHA